MAQAPEVGVVGLRALRRDINRLTDLNQKSALMSALAEAGRTAADPVASAARSSLPQLDTPEHPAGTMANDVRLVGAKTGAGVKMGRASLPYAGPLEFGGWPPGRDMVPDGRYLFPAARDLASTSAELYSVALQRGFDAAVWTNETTNAEAIHD